MALYDMNFPRLTASAVFIIGILVARAVILHYAHKSGRFRTSPRDLKRRASYLTSFVLILGLFVLWLPSLGNILALFSIVATAFVIVNKELFLNFSGWIYIIFRRPLEIGNRISIGDYSGDVIDIRIMEFSMIEVAPKEEGGQSSGRIIRIPNSFLFVHPLINSSKEFAFIWNELKICLSPDSDWEKALLIVEKTAEIHQELFLDNNENILHSEKKYDIRYKNLRPRVYIEAKKEFIQITLRHLSHPRQAREISDTLWRDILTGFKKSKNIRLA